jgi:6-phosphogluconolactonase
MHHELESLADPDALAGAGVAFVAARACDAVATSGRFHFAVSGGHTRWAMFAELASQTVPLTGSGQRTRHLASWT